MRRLKHLHEREQIRPVVYGIGLYFLLSCMDSFYIPSVGSILKLVALIPLVLSILDLRRWKLRVCPTLGAQLLFWILTVASILYSLDAERTLASVKPLTLNLSLVLSLGIMERYSDRELQFMQRAMLAGGWLTLALMLLFSDFSLEGRLTLLLGSKTQDQNYINGYFLYTFSWHCRQLFAHKKKLHLIPLTFILAVVLMTGSRGALAAFLFIVFVHMCFTFSNSTHQIRNTVLSAMVIVLLLVAFDIVVGLLPDAVARRFSLAYLAEKGTTGRTRIWRFLLEHYFNDNILRMLFGHGYGTTVLVNTLNGYVAHNLYLDNLITLGALGIVLQIITQGSILRVLHRRRLYALLGAYWGMIGMCFSLSLVSYKPIWNIMLLTLAIDSNHRNTYTEDLRPASTPSGPSAAVSRRYPSRKRRMRLRL